MQLCAGDISIGVTLYQRLDFLAEALGSAVNQTVPVKVILYDDGCQDREGLERILAPFGDRVEYRRNPKTLGLFGNMNRCIWESPTPWVSVLHDDDALAPDFVEQILRVAPEVDGCSLFCGGTLYINHQSQPFFTKNEHPGIRWRRIPLTEFAHRNQFGFPGQLIHAATAREVAGFPVKSIYTGDWELWFRLALAGGAVQLGANLSYYRCHEGENRGTTAAGRSGRKTACCAMQSKRNFSRLRQLGLPDRFDRQAWLLNFGPLYRDLLTYSPDMPAWLLRYNRHVLLIKKPEGLTCQVLHYVSKFLGNPGIRLAGRARTLSQRLGMKMPQTF